MRPSIAWLSLTTDIRVTDPAQWRNPSRSCPVAARRLFAGLDAPALKPLPAYPTSTPKWCRCWSARITTSTWKHYYSVPYALQGKRLEAHLAERTVTLYHAGKVVAQHPRSHRKGQHSSLPAHMPAHHQAAGVLT